jgi:ATP-binding cassette, subfamily B, multidrug efflux pump
MLKLLKFLKPYWWQVLVLLAATGGQVYATLRLPALMADIINSGIVKSDTNSIWMAGVQMLMLAIISALCALIANCFSARIGTNFSRDVRASVFAKVLNFSISDTKEFSTASLITRTTNDVDQVQRAVVMMLSLMLRAPLFCIIAIIMAIQTAPDMLWIIALSVVAILGSVILIMSLVIPKFKVFQKLIDRITLLTRENLTGLRVIRAFNNEKIEKEKFSKTNDKLTRLLIFIDKIMELQNPLINMIFNGSTLLCYWVGISLLNTDYAYLGNMAAFAQYVTYVMMAFLMLSILFVMLPRANVSAERINEVLKAPSGIYWKDSASDMPNNRASVEFKNVDFSYPDADDKMLADISFMARAGETTAFIGSTGSGKSTLISLVPRFYDATAGEILINGVNIKEYSQDDLMKKIGFVPQRGVLFSGTVKSNIMFGAPNASMADVEQAAEISQSKEFIEKMPEKYNSHISQGGTNVSGGQKQRLSIARAICKKPDIYVFDDSFSALDMKTDNNLRNALKTITQDAVVLIVAQRISTIKNAGQIIVLDNGKIVGKGTHLELLKKCKIYQDIAKSQFSEKEYALELAAAKAIKTAKSAKQKQKSPEGNTKSSTKEAYA